MLYRFSLILVSHRCQRLTTFKIVPDESSSLDFPGQETFQIDANHMEMCRFRSDDDVAYEMVKADVEEMVRGVVSRADQRQQG
jgi:hypothetical protein